jgi:hypothetical protein
VILTSFINLTPRKLPLIIVSYLGGDELGFFA